MSKVLDPILLIVLSSLHLGHTWFTEGYNGSSMNLAVIIAIGIMMVKMGWTVIKVQRHRDKEE